MLDVNIYLDIARFAGGGCSLDDLKELRLSGQKNRAVELVYLLEPGRLPNGDTIEVWASGHIMRLVALKASQSADAPDERDRGLGFTHEIAQSLIDDLIVPLVTATNGGIVDVVRSSESPPLDHEDGLVHATARFAGHPNSTYDRRFCITRDKGFLSADTGPTVDKLDPLGWLTTHHRLASQARMQALARMTSHSRQGG